MKIIRIKSLLFTAALCVVSIASTAQDEPRAFGKTINPAKINPENGKIRCLSSEYEEYLRAQYPELGSRSEFEQWIAPKIETEKARRLSSPPGVTQVITIPVVVHVIHDGDVVGAGENIADAQVLSQIAVLNQDFRRMAGTPGFNNNPAGADVEIEFCLAQRDPNGNLTNGINRVNLGVPSWDTEWSIEGTMKTSTQWDPSQYFNIWVCRFGGNGPNGMLGVLGYAQFPSNTGLPGAYPGGSANTDGVVIGYQYFGSIALYPAGNYEWPYNRGRTTTHEVGHALGLRHINGDNYGISSCTVNASDSTNDYCPDTPPARDLNYTCNITDSCPSVPGNDMIENYMDYTPDNCMNIFTQDQKARMLTVMANSPRRASLIYSTVCQPPLSSPEFDMLQGINLYPNPAQDVLNIAVADSNLPDSYTISNNLGQTVAQVKVTNTASLTINTSAYSNGVYFIRINKGSESKTLKFIKN